MTYRIIQGDNRLKLKDFPDNHFDSVVCDPPYGIDFLGKAWDANTGALETYQECLRVLKPGGHILAFSAARTYHHLAITLEQAGFEIRDQIMWIYSSGFPKSQDVGKSIDRAAGKKDPNYDTTNNNGTAGGINLSFTEDHIGGSRRCNKCKKDVAAQYDCKDTECGLKYNAQTEEGKKWLGWGTALKPAHEPICLARKPLKLSIQQNVQKWGTGALNIDATRIPATDLKEGTMGTTAHDNYNAEKNADQGLREGEQLSWIPSDAGRFPSNVIGEIADGYQKYFYCPKVSRRERHAGFDLDVIPTDPSGKYDNGGYSANQETLKSAGNNHPTVKPVELMKYLIKLVTPANGTVLDPFCGSGSTGMAAVELGYAFVGIELDARYCQIASKRIAAWNKKDLVYRELFE